MDNEFGPGFLFADAGDLLVEFFDLFFNRSLVLAKFFLRESPCSCQCQVSTSVPLDACNSEISGGFLCR